MGLHRLKERQGRKKREKAWRGGENGTSIRKNCSVKDQASRIRKGKDFPERPGVKSPKLGTGGEEEKGRGGGKKGHWS